MIAWIFTMAAHADPAPGPPAVEGRYQMTLSVTTQARVPVLGWLPSTTVSTVLVDLTSDGAGWAQSHEVCNVKILANGKKARTQIPPAFVDALPVKRYPVQITPTETGWSYSADMGVDHVGYDPALTSTVPQKLGDPGIIDPDQDGNPGMTVLLRVPLFGSAELYVVQRGQMTLEGEVGSDGVIRGELSLAQHEQRTLWATNRLFRMSPPIRPVEGESWFELTRADDKECVDLGLQPAPE